MMSGLVLKQIEISNFRVYGEKFALSPPGRGVTLLVGQNGLGKTSLFEAVEWALTGEVRRLMEAASDRSTRERAELYARRQADGSAADSYSVSLQFSSVDEEWTLERSAKRDRHGNYPQKCNYTPEQLARLLGNLRDGDTKNLGSFLRLTHILSQSAGQRFSARSPTDRWGLLSGPAGTSRLVVLHARLGNRGIKAAFNRKKETMKQQRDAAASRRREWHELLGHRGRLVEQAAGAGAIRPEQFEEALADLEEQMKSVLVALGRHVRARTGDNDARLERCVLGLREGLLVMDARERLLETLTGLPQLIRQEAASVELTRRALERAERVASECTTRAASARGDLTAAMKLQEDTKQRRTAAELNVDLWARIDKMLSERSLIEANRSKVLEQTGVLERSLAELGTEIANVANELAARAASEQRLATVTTAMLAWTGLADAVQGLEGREPKVAALRDQLVALQLEMLQLESRIETQSSEHAALQREWDLAADNAEAVLRAVGSIAIHLTDDEQTCPVCRTQFPAGNLKKLAQEAAQEKGENRLISLRNRLNASQEELAALERRRLECRGTIERAQRELNDWENVLAELRRRMALLGAPTSDPAIARLRDYINTELQRLRTQHQEEEQVQRRLRSSAELNTRITELQRQSQGASNGMEQLVRSGREMARTLEQANRFLQLHREIVAKLEASREALNENIRGLEELRLREQQIDADVKQKEDSTKAAERAEVIARQEVDSLKVTLTQQTRARDLSLQRWKDSGFEGEPTEASLNERRKELAERRLRLLALTARHQQLADAAAQSRNTSELTRVQRQIDQMKKELRVEGDEDASRALKENEEAAINLYRQVERAEKAVEQLQTDIIETDNAYSSRFIAPLNSLHNAFWQSLTRLPGVELEMRPQVQKKETKLHWSLMNTNGSTRRESDLSPEQRLSEGQLSALSTSLFLTMSTAYRWSRWRALLLDDPLQYNDLIHSTAFIELLRNLVREQEYQVILSTHDSELASFIRRKLDSARIENMTCRFLGLKQNGVDIQIES